jgi:molybdopterin converting factor small subunit
MNVRVTCIGTIARELGITEKVVTVKDGSTVSAVASSISPLKPLRFLPFVNGRKVSLDYGLREGDAVKLIPIVGAG